MLNPVSPWTATVQEDLGNSDVLLELERRGYHFSFHNTSDSIWLVVHWPTGGSIAFRLAFGMNSPFAEVDINHLEESVKISATSRLGNYEILIHFPEDNFGMIRYTTRFRATFPFFIRFMPRDIVPLTKDGRIENTTGKIHTHQIGNRSGQLYFSMTKPQNGSVFYFQNLTSLSPYCEACGTSLADSVGGEWPEIGFQFPTNPERPIPSDKEFTMTDAYMVLSDQIPQNDKEQAEQFLECLAAVYALLPKPETQYHNWPEIAERALHDLQVNKGCWTQTNGTPYLNAYVTDYQTPAEIMVQLSVLLPLQEYLKWKGKSHPVFEDLNEGISQFYDHEIKSIVRWHPDLEDELDHSEEQKREMVMDSWYLHHPLLNLSRLALRGDKVARKLFLDSIEYAMKVAKHFNYNWPVFYKMTTLEVLKAETSPGNGGEKDVPGSYAHVMLMAFKITGEKRYFREAVKAVRQLEGIGFDIFYQANNTAFAAGALLELYLETRDKHYLELSYCCLAGIFKNVQLWDCQYGNAKYFSNFFAVFPLNDAPYTAAYEELEVYAALSHYLDLAEGIDILPSLRILLPEFIKYTVNRLPYYYPPMLPPEILAEEVKTGEIQKDLWVPLEDLQDGWERNGQIGQEVYGAGLPFGVVPRQYHPIKGTDMMLFCDYPCKGFRFGKNKITFTIIGNKNFMANVKILNSHRVKFKFEQKTGKSYKELSSSQASATAFHVNADALIRITWD